MRNISLKSPWAMGQGAADEVFLSKTPEEISFAKENPLVAIKVRNFTVYLPWFVRSCWKKIREDQSYGKWLLLF